MAKKINKTKLQKLKKNELVQLAETNGITGAKAFKKQELIDRLSTLAQKKTPTASIHKPARKLRGKSIPTVPIHEVIIVNESKVSQESDYGIGLPPVSEQSSCDEGRGLPFSYNTTKLVAMVRDPEWAYTYWDFDGDTYNKITYLFREKSNTIKPILRVYEITGIEFDGTACNYSWDIDVHLDAKSWYVRLGDDNKVYVLDLGLLGDDNTFYLIARSN
ncbi:MAG: DUF4912 domain-containing protein, partial [Candidatus Omnitrophica bacterium]|nr:DUF4912 domain-containing protein [Candidatus Omnitrophota bacterium]